MAIKKVSGEEYEDMGERYKEGIEMESQLLIGFKLLGSLHGIHF